MGVDVVVVGNVGVDTNVYLPGRDIDWAREANFTEDLDYVGQAGGYTARGYARLGLATAFIGHVGDDFLGRHVRAVLERDGIDLRGLGIDPAGTARSVNIMDKAGGRKNFYDGKGHTRLRVDPDLARSVLRGARLAHVHLPDWARHLLPVVRAEGVTLACDLQDVVDLDDPYRKAFIEASDLLFLSAANHGSPLPLLEALQARRPGRVVVAGLGARGCAMAAEGRIRTFPPVEGPPVVDSNGAGDGLAVGFLTSFVLEGRSLEESVRRGQIVARHTCAQRASTDHLITREQLEARVHGLQGIR